MTPEERQAFTEKQRTFWQDEGVLATITASARGESGTVFASNGSPRTGDPTKNMPSVAITAENYNRIARLLEHDVPVKLSFDIKVAVRHDATPTAFNVIAEIPGTTKPNEIVMVGGHFDSWHMGTGATDNGAGSAVAMEVMRILKSLNLKMDRTVRMAPLGRRRRRPAGLGRLCEGAFRRSGDHEADGRTRRLRGVFQYRQRHRQDSRHLSAGQRNGRPIFEQWFAALKDLTPGVITIRNTGGTDHQSFDAVGLPGFQFIQDPMDYDTRTHHSNMDVYDRIQQADMEQMAMIEAAFVYNAATRPENLAAQRSAVPQAGRGGRGGRGGN